MIYYGLSEDIFKGNARYDNKVRQMVKAKGGFHLHLNLKGLNILFKLQSYRFLFKISFVFAIF